MRAAVAGIFVGLCVMAARLGADDVPPRIRALASIEIRYVEDGAADATVVERPDPRVKAIVDLGDRAVPMLIDCLASLDVLMLITDCTDAHVEDCADDGFGACMNEDFYFRPDIYSRSSNISQANAKVAAVRSAWRKTFRRGRVKFIYPS